MISILCPSRGRPFQYERMFQSMADTISSDNCRVFLGLNEHDSKVYKVASSDVILPDNMPTSHKWNLLALKAMEYHQHSLFMLGADDIIFATPLWDKALIDHYNSLENKIHVYALRDSRDLHGTPHPIVTREYIETMGYFMPPIFLHWFIDTWTVEIAKANGCFTHLENYLLIHDKLSDKGLADETHNRIRVMGWHERDTYVNKTCQHFLEQEKSRLAKIMLSKQPERFVAQQMDL